MTPAGLGEARKTGYLKEDFRIFYNADTKKRDIPFHYHDFHKLVLFLAGNVSYNVEGRQYDLQPNDIILVKAGQIHRPVIHTEELYERIIIYISDSFFSKAVPEDTDLFECFTWCEREQSALISPVVRSRQQLSLLASELKEAVPDQEFGAPLLRRLKCMELLLFINRSLKGQTYVTARETVSTPSILKAVDYINAHLQDEELSVDTIARETALNRSYLMHLFKAQTGYTIGGYIKEKRLFHACRLLEGGAGVTQACYESGFGNYSAFYYAYRKKYGSAPARERAAERQIEGE